MRYDTVYTVYEMKGETNQMKMTKCDVCRTVVPERDAAMITIRPGNSIKRWEFTNAGSKTAVCEESFDLCRTCVMKTLRKYYGDNFGKGDEVE